MGTIGPRGEPAGFGAPPRERTARPSELAVDRVIDQRYRLLERIGSGGSSQVFLAQDVTLGRRVAIKVLADRAADDEALHRLFAKEGRALAQIAHPNVVAVHDVGELEGRPFIVMEHVEGISLKERIERTGPLALADTLRIGTLIAEGLEFTHSRGIIHADLKPSNILLDQDENPKICDFGIARAPQEDAETPQLFATAMYVAPERVEGKRASVESDIYGLGLLLYEMLVGHPPFTSANPSVLLRDHVVRQPLPPSHLRPSLPRELDAVVLKALAKDPALRYRRAADVADALREVADTGAAQRSVAQPTDEIVPAPKATRSPVLASLASHAGMIRRAFFAALVAAPVVGLALLAGFEPLPSLLVAGLLAGIALIGLLGLAIGLAWLAETALIALFMPTLALLFGAIGLVIWMRGAEAEETALALAMPVAAPLGLGPALVFASTAVRGLGGIASVALGAVAAQVFAVAAGRQALGPFLQTGLSLEQESLFGLVQAVRSKSAISRILDPSPGDAPLDAILLLLDPARLTSESGILLARIATGGLVPLANVGAWVLAAFAVWAATKVVRGTFTTVLRRRAPFALYVLGTSVGVTAGAVVLYLAFTVAGPLANAPGRIADNILLLSALTGAVLALAAAVVISAIAPPEETSDESPPPVAARVPAR